MNNSIDDVRIIEFQQRGDSRGYLVVAEVFKDIPFKINRVFYMFGSDENVIRGKHANKESEFVLINVSGHSKIKVTDQSGSEKIFILDKPHMGIYIPPRIWKYMYDFSKDSVLLVLASTYYNSEEYIRDYDEYMKEK